MVATDGDIPQSVKVLEMTGNGLEFLDAPPLMGRVFSAAEAPEGVAPPPVAVISYPFWKTHFANRADVLGQVLELDHQKYAVIGVMGPRFTWHDSEVYLPMPAGMDPKNACRRSYACGRILDRCRGRRTDQLCATGGPRGAIAVAERRIPPQG